MGKAIAAYAALLDKATSDRGPKGIPNVTVIAADSSGRIIEKIESGFYHPDGLNPKSKIDNIGNNKERFTADTCVEKKILNLDDDVSQTWLPEFKDIDIYVELDEDENGNEKPIFQKAKNKVTLRNLLNHTSGIAYEFTHPKLNDWRQWHMSNTENGEKLAHSSNPEEAYRVPLLFEPGEGWIYGYGIDWAGIAVMRATKQTLEEYMSTNIWKPCGMTSTTFSLEEHRPDLLPRLAGMTMRDGDGKLEDLEKDLFSGRSARVKHAGGGGAFSTANDYIKLLSSLLHSLKSSKVDYLPDIISRSTLEAAFGSKIGKTATSQLNFIIHLPMAEGLAGNIPKGTGTTYALGGIVNLKPLSNTGRAAGGIQWSGIPNCFWWISPDDDLCGCYFTQTQPTGDLFSLELYAEFERAVLSDRKTNRTKSRV